MKILPRLEPDSLSSHTVKLYLVGLVIAAASLCFFSAKSNSPTIDEPGHILAGCHFVVTGQTALYRVNPPLSRLVAVIPSLSFAQDVPWKDADAFRDVKQPIFPFATQVATEMRSAVERAVFLLTIPVLIFAVASSKIGLNQHFRYVLPAPIPFCAHVLRNRRFGESPTTSIG